MVCALVIGRALTAASITGMRGATQPDERHQGLKSAGQGERMNNENRQDNGLRGDARSIAVAE